MTSASSMHEAGHSKSVCWDNPERSSGKGGGGGRHVHPWPIHADVWHKPPQDCEGIILQLK